MINNLPEYAKEYKYIVVRECSPRDFWFWGAYNDRNFANQAAMELGNGVVFHSEDI